MKYAPGINPYSGQPNFAAPAPGLSSVGEYPLAATLLGLDGAANLATGGAVSFSQIRFPELLLF